MGLILRVCSVFEQFCLWLDGGVAVLSRLEPSVGHGHEVSRFLQPLPVRYNNFLHVFLAPAIPTGMPGRVPVRSW